MKLLTLQIKNFISIKESTLDFSKFKPGVFLISGPTGSGKSTILDAIHWAFYGVTLNQNRNQVHKTIVSDYAAPKEDAKVTIKFIQDSTTYTIVRTMNREGNSTIKFTTPDMIYDKIRESNAAIEKVIGLNAKQFDQMVMLEQGNFSKFLLTDSKDRASLLRNVFDTQLFQNLEQRFKTKVDSYKQEIDNIGTLEQTFLAGQSLESIKSRIATSEQDKQDAETRVDTYNTELTELQVMLPELHTYESQRQAYDKAQQELQRLEQLKPHIDKLLETKEYVNKYKQNIVMYDKSVSLNEEIDKAKTKVKEFEAELWHIKSEPVTNTDVQALRDELSAKATLKLRVQTKAKLNTELAEVEANIATCTQDIEALNTEVTNLRAEYDDLNAKITERKTYDTEFYKYTEKLKDIKDKETKLHKVEEEFTKAEPQYIAALKSHLLELCPQGKCPICNSDYTATVESTSTNISFEQLQQLKTEREAIKLWLNANSTIEEPTCTVAELVTDLNAKLRKVDTLGREKTVELQRLQQSLNTYTNSKTVITTKLSALTDVPDSIEGDIDAEIFELTNKITDTEEKVRAHEEAERQKIAVKSSIETWKAVINGKQEEAKKQQIDLNSDVYKEGLEYRELINDYEKNRDKYTAEVENYNKERERLLVVEEPVAKYDMTVLECNDKIGKLNGLIQEAIRTVESIKNTVDADIKLVENIENLHKRRDEILPVYKELSYIHTQISGKNKCKLSLENFVLHRQLEWILDTSNEFLATLSNNQFRLDIKWESSGRSQGGLEISIFDSTSGKSRPAQTYSGGELFILSLSLSLGLMSSIDALFSGLDLDLLIVDEGFGTLDTECLARVLNTLQTLRNISTVGIISHVQELIDTVPQGFLVNKTVTGTNIKQFLN